MSGNGMKVNLEDNIGELEKQAVKIEKLISFCSAVRSKLMVECFQLKSELRNLQDSTSSDKVKETSSNLDSVGTNIRLDLSVPSSSFYNNEEEEEEMDEEE